MPSAKNRFQNTNPFEVLDSAADTGRGGSDSSGSSALSFACIGLSGPNDGPVNSPMGQVARSQPTHHDTPDHTRQLSVSSSNGSASTFASPTHSRVRAGHDYSNGSPVKIVHDRLNHLRNADQSLQASPQSPRRSSFSSHLRAPSMLNTTGGPNGTSMVGIPEVLAVQELGFRRGQQDHGTSRDRIPSNPFAKQFDANWEKSYRFGKAVGGAPAAHPACPSPSTHPNHSWEALINPYTQSLEHPEGQLDVHWTRQICIMALNCMQELIRVICRRRDEWQKIVCDVPVPAQQAIMAFPDLRQRYENLKQDAREALNGRYPYRG